MPEIIRYDVPTIPWRRKKKTIKVTDDINSKIKMMTNCEAKWRENFKLSENDIIHEAIEYYMSHPGIQKHLCDTVIDVDNSLPRNAAILPEHADKFKEVEEENKDGRSKEVKGEEVIDGVVEEEKVEVGEEEVIDEEVIDEEVIDEEVIDEEEERIANEPLQDEIYQDDTPPASPDAYEAVNSFLDHTVTKNPPYNPNQNPTQN